MTSYEILILLKKFDWNRLNQIYGCAHSSIIGFIAYEWLGASPNNSVLDGAPSPFTGTGRTGQQNADLLLCKNYKPLIPVEVETSVDKYNSKLVSLFKYKEAFEEIDFGLFYLTNLTTADKKYQHNWDELKETILNQPQDSSMSIALISAIKKKIEFSNQDDWSTLLKRNDYSKWEIVRLDYWIYDYSKSFIEGNLWSK